MSLSKLFLTVVIVSAAASANAASTTAVATSASFEPNLFVCDIDKGEIVYATTSMSGEPTFSYSYGNAQTFYAKGNEIQTVKTELGTIVNVHQSTIPDLSTAELNLILPQVNLSAADATVTFSTQLVRSVWKSSIAGRAGVDGPVNTNEFIPATCKAQKVAF